MAVQKTFTVALALRGFPSQVCALNLSETGACNSFFLVGGTAPAPRSSLQLSPTLLLTPAPCPSARRAASLQFSDLSLVSQPSRLARTRNVFSSQTHFADGAFVFVPGCAAARVVFFVRPRKPFRAVRAWSILGVFLAARRGASQKYVSRFCGFVTRGCHW